MPDPTTDDEARDIRGLLHLAGTYATRAVAAAEAMDVAFKKALAEDRNVEPTDWALRAWSLAATSRACSDLAQARLLQADLDLITRRAAEFDLDLIERAGTIQGAADAFTRTVAEPDGEAHADHEPDYIDGRCIVCTPAPEPDPSARRRALDAANADQDGEVGQDPLAPLHEVFWDEDHHNYRCRTCEGTWSSVAKIPNLGCPEPERAREASG